MIDVSQRKGIFYMLIASFCFAFTGACARYLRDDINPIELVLFRNLIGVLFIGISVMRTPLIQVGGKPWLLVFRGVIGTFALYSFFYGISRIGLAISITYQQSYPVFLALIAAFFLGDKLKFREWIAILIGFSGICLIFLPSVDNSILSTKHHFIGISNAVMTGMAYLSIRGLSTIYDQRSIILSFMICGIVLPILSLLIGEFYTSESLDFIIDRFVMPQGNQWFPIIALGLAAMVGQIYLTKAFSYQKTGVIAAIGYSNIIFSIIFGTLLGDAFPEILSLLGIVLIIICGILVSLKPKVTSYK
jgi:drug/metabolite transporter (DMT)-like permease